MSKTATHDVANEGTGPASRYRDLTTGALMAGSTLYLATIGVDASGRIRLVKSMSQEFQLHGRDQVSLTTFTSFVLAYLLSKGIESLQFICSPSRGGHMAGAYSYKVEAALQLLPHKVHLIQSASITQYSRKVDAPGSDRARLGATGANLQQRALVAAAYGLAKRRSASSKAQLSAGLVDELEPSTRDNRVVMARSTPAPSADIDEMRPASRAGETPKRSLKLLAKTAESGSVSERTEALIASL